MIMATNWINEKENLLTLEKECFCTHNNGAMQDLMAELDGTHALVEKETIVELLAKELYNYNEEHCASVFVEDFSMEAARALARDEFLRRARLNWDDAASFVLHDEEAIDTIRMMAIA